MSHRAIIFGALAEGTSRVTGLLEGADILSTIGAMRAFGAKVERTSDGDWTVQGCGKAGLQTPSIDVDCGNAGTGVRLIMGAASAYPISARYVGDASLSSRPMGRVTKPLQTMGVKAEGTNGDRLPMTLTSPTNLKPIDYTPPIASAQVKSALLLAGLGAKGTTRITEPHLTRDHTENMLRAFGCKVEQEPFENGQIVSVTGPVTLTACDVNVPGDPSSASFPIAAACVVPGSDVTVTNVMMNPTRTGLLETLVEMGANIETSNMRESGGEAVADIRVRYAPLHGVTVPTSRAPSMIDEYPILAVIAAFAEGETVMDGLEELRVKESDRISATVALLEAAGANIQELKTGMVVTGSGGKPLNGGGTVTTHHDHRIAMSALIAGLNCKAPMSVDDASMIATSFPNFFDMMAGLGAPMSEPQN